MLTYELPVSKEIYNALKAATNKYKVVYEYRNRWFYFKLVKNI